MKLRYAFSLLLVLPLSLASLHAQTAPPAPAAPDAPAATETPDSAKIPTTGPDNGRYLRTAWLLKGCQANLDAAKGQPCDMIFIGDSITAGWIKIGKAVWDKYYTPRHALDFGVSGDRTQNVIWRLDNMDLSAVHPKIAVVLIGTNNLGNTPQEIADGVKMVITKTQAHFPGIKTILVSITPSRRAKASPNNNDKMMAADQLLKTLADDKTIYYLDLVPLMPPVGDNYKGLRTDHLHPDESGYQIWADAMEPLLKKLGE